MLHVPHYPFYRKLVTLAGIIPDADGLGMVADVVIGLVSGREVTFQYYQRFHHLWLHGWPGALLIALVLAGFGRQRIRVAGWCLVTFHLHLLCDLLGSRGPSLADLWPICYSEPLFRHPVWYWQGQWRLDGWENTAIFVVILALALWVAVKRGCSVVEVFSQRGDRVLVGVLRNWVGRFRSGSPGGPLISP